MIIRKGRGNLSCFLILLFTFIPPHPFHPISQLLSSSFSLPLPHTPPPSSSFPLLLLPSFFIPSRSLLVLVPGGRPLLPLLPSLPPREKNRFTHVSTNGEFHPLALPRPVLLHAAVAAGKWVNLLYKILVYCLFHALFILHARLSCR